MPYIMRQKASIVREINAVFEEKIIHQTHVNLVALKEEFSAKVDLRSAGGYWNHKVELCAKVTFGQTDCNGAPKLKLVAKGIKITPKMNVNNVTAITIAERIQ